MQNIERRMQMHTAGHFTLTFTQVTEMVSRLPFLLLFPARKEKAPFDFCPFPRPFVFSYFTFPLLMPASPESGSQSITRLIWRFQKSHSWEPGPSSQVTS